MKSRLVRLELNSAGLGDFLARGDAVVMAVDSAASDIETALVPAIEESRTKAEGSKSKTLRPSFEQKTFVEKTRAHDGRYKVEVGIENMSNSDFIFSTLPRAVYRAGGHKSRRSR